MTNISPLGIAFFTTVRSLAQLSISNPGDCACWRCADLSATGLTISASENCSIFSASICAPCWLQPGFCPASVFLSFFRNILFIFISHLPLFWSNIHRFPDFAYS
jgi:hypothetical protein